MKYNQPYDIHPAQVIQPDEIGWDDYLLELRREAIREFDHLIKDEMEWFEPRTR